MLRDDGSHNGRTWVIDPLDGTVNYANGIPFYCVSIGLVVDDRPDRRRDLRSRPRRPVRRRRSTGRPASTASRSAPRPRKPCPTTSSAWPSSVVAAWRASDGSRRRSESIGAWGARRWHSPTSPTGASTPSSRTAASRPGTSPPPVSSPSGRARSSPTSPAGRGGTRALRGPRTSVVAAPAAQHAAAAGALAAEKTTVQTRR